MAGPVCKIILNRAVAAVTAGLEEALLSPAVRGKLIAAEKCDAYIDRMAKIDLSTYAGIPTTDSLVVILLDLEKDGLITDEVWKVLQRPGDFRVPGAGSA